MFQTSGKETLFQIHEKQGKTLAEVGIEPATLGSRVLMRSKLNKIHCVDFSFSKSLFQVVRELVALGFEPKTIGSAIVTCLSCV
jgi:hypothetical protein